MIEPLMVGWSRNRALWAVVVLFGKAHIRGTELGRASTRTNSSRRSMLAYEAIRTKDSVGLLNPCQYDALGLRFDRS